jgi:hypothetical protein
MLEGMGEAYERLLSARYGELEEIEWWKGQEPESTLETINAPTTR